MPGRPEARDLRRSLGTWSRRSHRPIRVRRSTRSICVRLPPRRRRWVGQEINVPLMTRRLTNGASRARVLEVLVKRDDITGRGRDGFACCIPSVDWPDR